MKISATVITLNEEKNIGACLESLDFADEIIVVDSGSIDRTKEICQNHPRVRFYGEPWQGFGRQKNSAATVAANDWILNIDADERVSGELRKSILSADCRNFAGFRMARENYFGKRWIRHCGWYPDYNLRLYNRNSASFRERDVHEAVVCTGPVGTLAGNLRHYTYENIADYVKRMDRYSTLAAEELIKGGKTPGAFAVLFRPIYTFVRMYFLQRGFLEGYLGLLLALLYANYTFLKYAKAAEKTRER